MCWGCETAKSIEGSGKTTHSALVPVRNWPTGKSSAPARSAGLRKFLRKSLPIQVHPPEGVPGVSWDYGGPSGGKIRANLAGIFPPHGSSQRHLWHELAKPRWLGSIGRACGCFRGESASYLVKFLVRQDNYTSIHPHPNQDTPLI